ncbi:MAG TPA: hypothetical protein VMA86_01405 [Acetobacteraceae bacterium]|nr:hypothetical protein [Acetobacteraceae bacterium]
MKTIFGATLAALVLSGSAMAATVNQLGNAGPQGIEFASTISTPYTYGNGDSQQAPVFNYQGSVPVNASVGGVGHAPALRDSTWNLVNRTGSGR